MDNGTIGRRGFLGTLGVGIAGGTGALAIAPARAVGSARSIEDADTAPDHFPSQDPANVRSTVGASHGNMARVVELVEAQPALAKAAVDWGFGDWESALGAASHVGNREIALFLIKHGARPDIFACAMLGWVDAVRGMVEAGQGVHRLYGPHGFTLMHHARAGRDEAKAVVEYLEGVEGADDTYDEVALDEDGRAVYLGTYSYGPGADQSLVVLDARGSVWLERVGGTRRRLVALGDHTFHPVGAEAVRVRFAVDGAGDVGVARSLTVHDPAPVVTAMRTGG